MRIVGKIAGVGILIFMLATYLSFFAGLSFWYYDFLRFLRWIDFPEAGWIWLDQNIFNGAL